MNSEPVYAQIMRERKHQKTWAGIVVFFVVLWVVMTLVALYTWSSGFMTATSGGAGAPTWYKQEVPAEPKSMVIGAVLDCGYVRIEDKQVPIYTLHYNAEFIYRNTNTEKAYIPLPSGSVENLAVKLNNVLIQPNIQSHKIVLDLPAGENTVYISYTTRGSYEYSHSVPKDRLMEKFYMKLEIKNIKYDRNLPSECLEPDKEYISDGNTVFEWDKKDAVLRKEIIVELPEWKNPFDTYLSLLPWIFLLLFLLGLFYYEAFRRTNMQLNIESFGFLIVPFILLMLSVPALVVYIDVEYAVGFSIIFAVAAMFVIKKKVLMVTKAFLDIFLLPALALISVCTFVTVSAPYGGTIGIICIILSVLVGVKFFKENKGPKEKISIDSILTKIQSLSDEKKQVETVLENERKEKELLKERIKKGVFAKNFCLYCKSIVKPDFDFCPKCGKEIKYIEKCEKCGSLVHSEIGLYCPNCGEPLKKGLNAGMNLAFMEGDYGRAGEM
ncbi:MAG: zinc ribbon domain-containing protein [Thermoplasmatales archaeon]|nr:zinc ribbon domain-containing protein [Thermoplasmatales archaeon]